MAELFLTDFDQNPRAVLEPNHEQAELGYQFQPKLLFAFTSSESIATFLKTHAHCLRGYFDSFGGKIPIYEVELNQEKITFCQAKLGAPAATMLLDWLISYGVRQVLAVGSAGALVELPENYFLFPTRAIRDEGTSFHYLAPSNFVDLQSPFLAQIKKLLSEINFKVREVTTWTTDGFFRETTNKVQQFKQLGAACVEMECAALAACAQFRQVDFAQLLFTADSLSKPEEYEARGWGKDAHGRALTLAGQVLAKL